MSAESIKSHIIWLTKTPLEKQQAWRVHAMGRLWLNSVKEPNPWDLNREPGVPMAHRQRWMLVFYGLWFWGNLWWENIIVHLSMPTFFCLKKEGTSPNAFSWGGIESLRQNLLKAQISHSNTNFHWAIISYRSLQRAACCISLPSPIPAATWAVKFQMPKSGQTLG